MALATVLQCDAVENIDSLCALLADGWPAALRTFAAHRPEIGAEIDGCRYRVSSVRKGAGHGFDSQQLNAALGDAVGALQPSWSVDLETPDVCIVCLLTDRRAIIGLLLPPLHDRTTANQAKPATWTTHRNREARVGGLTPRHTPSRAGEASLWGAAYIAGEASWADGRWRLGLLADGGPPSRARARA